MSLMFCDLDTYKVEALTSLTPEELLEALLLCCAQQGVPVPSIVIFSGRGLQVKWLLNGTLPAKALPRWNVVQRELCRRLQSMGSDFNALDAARVLRLVDTVNSRSGAIVRVLFMSEHRFKFDELANTLLPFTRDQLEELREKRQGQKELQTDLPSHSVKQPSSGNNGYVNLRSFSAQQLAWDRLADIRKLAALRGWSNGAPDGSRDLAMFLSACFLASALPNLKSFVDELQGLRDEFAPHWTTQRLSGCVSAVQHRLEQALKGLKIEYNGKEVDPRYRLRNTTLIDLLYISPDEERQLQTIISKGEKNRRAAERKQQRRKATRESCGSQTRLEYEAIAERRRVEAAQHRSQGKSWQEVAELVGYSSAESARKSCSGSCHLRVAVLSRSTASPFQSFATQDED